MTKEKKLKNVIAFSTNFIVNITSCILSLYEWIYLILNNENI